MKDNKILCETFDNAYKWKFYWKIDMQEIVTI